jgi:hypothetical protein
LLDLAFICGLVFLEQVEGIGLRWRLWVGLVEKRLDAEEDLLDVYRRLPAFFFVEDTEADGARWVDIWMK